VLQIINKTPEPIEYKNIFCSELFETIKSIDGIVQNLQYHQARLNNAYKEFFKKEPLLNLQQILNPPPIGLYRIKVIYNINGLVSIDYFNYKPKTINKIMLIEASNLNYTFKYTNRDFFNTLYNIYSNVDEFIITKNGFLCDTTIANIALYHTKEQTWHTPKKPLLYGTTLARYLKAKKLTPKDIHYTNLKNYSKIALLNAMIDFKEVK